MSHGRDLENSLHSPFRAITLGGSHLRDGTRGVPLSAPFLTRFASLLCHLALKHVLTGLFCPQDLEPLKSRYAAHYFGLPKGLETMPGMP